MSKLEPFKDLPVDFGKPMDFTPPSTDNLVRRFIDEAHEVEDHEGDGNFNAHEFADSIWQNSLSKEEYDEYMAICAECSEAEKNYNPRKDGDDSEAAQRYFEVSAKLAKYQREHGQHVCFHCTYYTVPLKPNACAGCFKNKKSIRPYTFACEYYTNTRTPEDEALDEKERLWMAQHPMEAKIIGANRKRESAERTAKRINEGNSVAFFSYDSWPDEIEEKYRKYPEIFAKTKYPTFEAFKAAAEAFLSNIKGKDNE